MADIVGWNGEAADLLALDPSSGDRFRNRSSIPSHGDRIYGGQMIGLLLSAGLATAAGRPPHSAHAYFIAAGSPVEPIELHVERTRDGRTTSLRQVDAWQRGRRLARMTCSFRDPDAEALSHQLGPAPAPPPEACEEHGAFVARVGDQMAAQLLARMTGIGAPIELRVIDEPAVTARELPPRRRFWIRISRPIDSDDPAVHAALLAYLSDYWLAGTAMNPHLGAMTGRYPAMVSLDHAMWFHREARADQWLLHELDSPAMARGAGLVRSMLYDATGRLVASTAQEAIPTQPRPR